MEGIYKTLVKGGSEGIFGLFWTAGGQARGNYLAEGLEGYTWYNLMRSALPFSSTSPK